MSGAALPSSADEYPDWHASAQKVLESPGTTLVLGATDVGKTTFTRYLTGRALERGMPLAVLDADPGQSEIGPPSCAGLALPDSAATLVPPAAALAFIGSVSPAFRLPEVVTAVRKLADQAGDRMLLVDTSGYVQGPGARRLIQCQCDMLAPRHVIAIQRNEEIQSLLAPLLRRSDCTVHSLKPPADVVRKRPALRAQRRALRFAAYFRESAVVEYALRDVAVIGSWLGSGAPVPPHTLRFIQSTVGPATRVYHAEVSGGCLGLIANRPIAAGGPEIGVLLGELKAREVAAVVAARLKHLLVGLEACNGKMLGLGLIASLDFRRGRIGVVTPVRSPEAAAALRLGMHRIAPDGTDEGALKPGEL